MPEDTNKCATALTVNIHGAAVNVTFENRDHAQHFGKLAEMAAFKDWCDNLSEDLTVGGICVQSIDMFGPRVGFVKFRASVTDRDGTAVPGIVFMRGGAVAVLFVIKCEDSGREYTILTSQARVPVAQSEFLELPAGMLDGSGDFTGVTAKEIKEETGLEVHHDELGDLTEAAFGSQWAGAYPSPGGCDEFIRLFLHRTTMKKEAIDVLKGRLTGERERGEKITLKVVPLDDLWRSTPDMKALAALCLYQKTVSRGV